MPPAEHRQEDDLRVVLILIDTLRADRMPPSRTEPAPAPFLEELAARSVVFRHAHSTSSWTAPAVASLFTSLHPIEHGVHTGLLVSERLRIEVNRLPDDVTLLPELFQRARYATLGVSDNVNVSTRLGFERGFHRFEEMNYEGAESVSAIALNWLDEISERRRSFLYLHFMDPHYPYHAREPWFEQFQKHESPDEARYDSEIRHVDEQIAMLFDRFAWDEDTLLVIASDHGEEFGDHGGEYHGHTLYSELIDVPLMMYCPRLWPTGRIVDQDVSLVDVLPTLAEICGLEVPAESRGTSLLALIEGRDRPPSPVYSHLRRKDLGAGPEGMALRSAIVGRRKLILGNDGTRQLFDLAADPDEQHDESQQRRLLVEALENGLRQYEASLTARHGTVDQIPIDDGLREKLHALGYTEASSER